VAQNYFAFDTYDPHKHEKREKNYGADISTLIRMIEAGEL